MEPSSEQGEALTVSGLLDRLSDVARHEHVTLNELMDMAWSGGAFSVTGAAYLLIALSL